MSFTAFSWGFIDVYWYGISAAAAVLCALIVSWAAVRMSGESFAPAVDIALWGIPSAFIMARAVYVAAQWQHFSGHPLSALAVWNGGLSIYGAVGGFLLAGVIYLKMHNLNTWHWLDLMAPGMAAALTVLQLTNFIMQLTVGSPLPADMPNDHRLAEYIEFYYRPSGFEDYLYFKPVALYQAGAQFIVFAVLCILWMIRCRRPKMMADGTLFLLMALALSAVRFGFGFMYLSPGNDVWLSAVQWISLAGMLGVVIVYIYKRWCSALGK